MSLLYSIRTLQRKRNFYEAKLNADPNRLGAPKIKSIMQELEVAIGILEEAEIEEMKYNNSSYEF